MRHILEASFPKNFPTHKKINKETEKSVEYLPVDRFPKKIKKIGKRSEPMSGKLGANRMGSWRE